MAALPASAPPPFCLSRPSKNKKNRRRLHKSKHPLFTSKSSPTPLLLNHPPPPKNKHQALDQLLHDLRTSASRGVKIEPSIFSSLLETCFQLQSLHHGIQLHRLIPPKLLYNSADLCSKLLRLYASCGRIEDAHQLFDRMPERERSAFAWNSLISGYVELGMHEDALALYFQMGEDEVEPDEYTFPRVLKACAGIGSIQIGEAVHRHIVRSGFAHNTFVLNALLDMYAKGGDIARAQNIFKRISERDSVSWNSMLTAYIRHGLLKEAIHTFRQMLKSGLEPDTIAISTMLTGSASEKLRKEIHGWVIRRGAGTSLSVANALITMYSRRGEVHLARAIFDEMPERDTVSWNAMIQTYSKGPEALRLFQDMQKEGLLPDTVTFMSLLSACANSGLVEDGNRLFWMMEERYGVSPGMEHYSCMVNLLGRAGFVEEAYEIIKKMGFEAGPTVWGALLFACSVHQNVEIGRVAGERLFELEPDNAHNFELLMSIYRNAGKLDAEENVRRLMCERGLDF